MKPEDFLKTTLTDIKVKLTDEFDRNFERKAFFDKKWKHPKLNNRRGSVMMRSGKLRRSIQSKITPQGIQFTSAMPYADIHNSGGEIVVTAKMKRFFWAMYYKALGATKTKTIKRDGYKIKLNIRDENQKKKTLSSNSKRAIKMKAEAEQWKALALKKVGEKMKVEQRQFIGHHPKIDIFVKEIINRNLKKLEIKPFNK